MNLFEKIAKKLRDVSASYGYTCDGCGAEIFDYPSYRFCEACENKIRKNDGRVCGKCGRQTIAEGICLSCKSRLPRFDKGVSPFVYLGETAALVNRLKNGNRRLALYFGERMTAAFLRAFPEMKITFDRGMYALNDENALLVLPVPMTENKRKERGYNQAEALAESVVKSFENAGLAAVLDTEALQKRHDTAQQKHLGFAAREKNALGAYHLHKRKICKSRTVLLVDDVMTTGATGNECARLLLNAGAKQVIFLVAAALPERK